MLPVRVPWFPPLPGGGGRGGAGFWECGCTSAAAAQVGEPWGNAKGCIKGECNAAPRAPQRSGINRNAKSTEMHKEWKAIKVAPQAEPGGGMQHFTWFFFWKQNARLAFWKHI
eukprot:gene20894-biopygen22145